MVGSSVGGYRILEKIRDGGAGTVFRAQGPKGEIVAIKMISEAWNELRDRRKAFRREADTTQKLVHPSVIRVFGYSEGPPRPYIVLEYFPSDNLKFTLWHKQQVLEGRRMPVLKQCAEALYYVHTQGVVHRDVKPENFLVNTEGSVRLIDFSIAQTKWDRFLFSFGKKVDGTPLYMAPEQIRNESQDQRTDMYSFGVMVFELMTRRPPFIGASVDSILEKHLRAAPPSMRSIVADLSPELDELVTKLLSKKAVDRPADMSFVIAVLNRLTKKEEEVRLREGKGPTRVIASVGQAGGTTQVPGTRPVGSRPTPSSVPAVPGGATPSPVPAAGGTAKPPSSSGLVPAKQVGAPEPSAAAAADAPATAATAGGPTAVAAGGPTRTQTKVRVPTAQPVTRTQTRAGAPSTQPPPGAQTKSDAAPPQPAPVVQTKPDAPPPQSVTKTQVGAGVPSAQPVRKTQTRPGVPPAPPVTRTITKPKPAGAAATAPVASPAPSAPTVPPAPPAAASAATAAPTTPQATTPEPPPPPVSAAAPPATEAAAPPATSPAAGPPTAPVAKEAAEAAPKPSTEDGKEQVEPAPEPPKGNE